MLHQVFFEEVLWECYLMGVDGCTEFYEPLIAGHSATEGQFGTALGVLSWFVNHGYLTNSAGHLNSMYGYGLAGVYFDVGVDDATGDVYVTLIQAPPATFSENLREALGYLSAGLTGVQVGGLALCGVTGGTGCFVSGAAGLTNIGVGGALIALDCSGGASTQCAWTAGTTVLSAGTTGGALAARTALVRAGRFEGVVEQLYDYGNLYTAVGSGMFSVAGSGIFSIRDDVNGFSAVTVRI